MTVDLWSIVLPHAEKILKMAPSLASFSTSPFIIPVITLGQISDPDCLFETFIHPGLV